MSALLLLLLLWARALLAIKIIGAGSGVDTSSGPRPLRYEINNFSQSQEQWDLYVQALSQIQGRSQSDPMSYFQIAGIHGLPQIPWDNVQGAGSYPGYCMHTSTLFPPWHRPYLALFEQAIWNAAQSIANSYPDQSRQRYQQAALTLRIPYWDNIANPALPNVITVPFVSIFTTNGQQTVSNPLYSYSFQSDAAGNGFPSSNPLANLACTVRHWDGKTNLSDHPAANAAMASTAPGLLSASYRIFSDTSDYTAFSTTAMLRNRTSTTGNNIEIIHNQIHNNLGGYGHMSWLELAAFDPIFWLHHANVDRMFAMWQALYPGAYVVPARNQVGSYYESIGTMDSGSSDLAPFHSTEDDTSMWTSDAVRSTAVFDYSYPELPDWTMNSSALADHVRGEINRLYNPPAPASRKRSIPRKARRAASIAEAFSHVTFDDAKMMGVNNANRQWFASIQLDRFAYSTSFAIYFFMGDPPADASQWSWAPNMIGAHAQFISADLSSMHPGGLPTAGVRGEVSLTHTLLAGVDRGMLPNLDPEAVVALLKQGLQWRARTPGGCEIDVAKLTGLMISIGSKSVKPTTRPQQFPVYGDAEWYPEITQNTPCDVKHMYRLAR